MPTLTDILAHNMAKKVETVTQIKSRTVRLSADGEGQLLGGGVVSVDVITEGPGGTLRSSEVFAFDGDEPTDEAILAEIAAR